MGSAVSQPCSTEHVSDDVATSTQPFSKPVACPAGVCLLVVASSFFRASESNVSHFYADGSGRFGPESCWGSAVSQPCSTEPLADEGATSTELLYNLDFDCKTMRTHNDTNDPQKTREVERSDAHPTLTISCLNCGVGGIGGSPSIYIYMYNTYMYILCIHIHTLLYN